MFYRPEERPAVLKFNPFKALVSPRPIAWVSSRDAHGRGNLAPFSYFNAVYDAPPMVMIAPNGGKPNDQGGGGPTSDTLSNILETGEFVISLVGFEQRDQMNATSSGYPIEVDEFDAVGVEAAPSEMVAPPRVAGSAAAFECKLLKVVELPSLDGAAAVKAVFGQVVGVHIRDDVIVDGQVDVTLYQPLARLGYRDYAAVRDVFQLNRPSQRSA